MIKKLSNIIFGDDNSFYYSSIALLAFFIILGISLDAIYLWAIPLVFLAAYFVIIDFKWVYLLFFFILPFTMEFYFSNGMGLDIPGELLLLLLTGISIVFALSKFTTLDVSILSNWITKLIVVHLIWILFTSITAQNPVIAVKFLLAKIWYVIPMYFMTLFLVQKKDIKTIVRNLVIALSILVVIVMFRHSTTAFDFSTINDAVMPLFRNHVTYASILVVVFPFLVLVLFLQSKGIFRIFLLASIFIFLAGIFLSYTRAAYVAIFVMPIVYLVVKQRLLKPLIVIGLIPTVGVIGFLVIDDNYLNYSPNYEKTIAHKDFDDIVNATYNGTDISTVERGYRWVAGYNMIKDKPILGFGPGNFYSCYRPYTVRSFETYVSDNPEKSGIHSYYLMTVVEQGFIGFIILMILVIYSLVYAENLYHKLQDRELKNMLMAVILSMVGVYLILLINDMLESIKVGTLYFFNLALIILIERWERQL